MAKKDINMRQIKEWRKQGIITSFKKQGNELKIYGFKFKDRSKQWVNTWLAENCEGELFDLVEKGKIIKAQHYTLDNTRRADAGFLYGEEKVIEQKNGVVVRLLSTPSPEYAAVLAERAERQAEEQALEETRLAEEQLIQDTMRELAKDKLKKEGKL